MNEDEELVKIFDNVEQTDEPKSVVSEENVNPSSSKGAEAEENLMMEEDMEVPRDPIGTATPTDEGGSMKRKTGKVEDHVGLKRVRIEEIEEVIIGDESEPCNDEEFINAFVNMGYERGRVWQMFIIMSKEKNHNLMLDRLESGLPLPTSPSSPPDSYAVCVEDGENGRRSSPFDGSLPAIEANNCLEQLRNLSEAQKYRPSIKQPLLSLPPFIDLCDDATLRRMLNLKFPASEETCARVVRNAHLMAERLKQVSHLSIVAKHATIIFPDTELYKHYMFRAPLQPESGKVDRAGMVKDMDGAQFGLIVDVAEAFVNNGGLKHVEDRIEDPAMSIRDVGYVCTIISAIKWLLHEELADELMEKAAERMRTIMKDHTDKEIRDERMRREIMDAARKVWRGFALGNRSSPRYEFLERLLLCGNMDAKKIAIEELVRICEHEVTETRTVRRWMKRRSVLSILLSDHLDHMDYVQKMAPILNKIAPVLSEREFRSVWCLQKGRGGITNDTFNLLLCHIVVGFEVDQIILMFKYCDRQLKYLSGQQLHNLGIRMLETMSNTLSLRKTTACIAERKTFIECFICLIDKILPMCAPFGVHWLQQGMPRVAECFLGLPSEHWLEAIWKIAKIIRGMNELDRRLPFYFNLMGRLCMYVRDEFPMDQRCQVAALLQHNKFIERSTRLLVGLNRNCIADSHHIDAMIRAHEEMKEAEMKKQQQAAADAAAASAPAAPRSTLQQQQLPLVAAVTAPPPSAVTPISNGPSPKRGEESPPGGSNTGACDDASAETSSTSDAAAAEKQPEVGKEPEDKVPAVAASASSALPTVCTPPSTPDPIEQEHQQLQQQQLSVLQLPQHLQHGQLLKVSTAPSGSKEWERDMTDRANQLSMVSVEANLRLVHCMSMLALWCELTMADDPAPGYDVQHLSAKSLEDVFAVLIEISKLGNNGRPPVWITFLPIWFSQPPSHFKIMSCMMKRLEYRPVYRTFISQLCAIPPEMCPLPVLEIVRTFIDRCFASSRYNTTTDWIVEALRMLWRVVTRSNTLEIRDKATVILKMVLIDRYRTLRLLTIFAAARFNEAIDEFNRLRGSDESPVGHWTLMDDEDDDDIDEETMEDNEGEEKEKKDEEGGEKSGKKKEQEEAMDLSLDPRSKTRTRTQTISRDQMEIVLKGMTIKDESQSMEEAEQRLSHAVIFLRLMIKCCYLEAKSPPDLLVLERALPGEVCDVSLKMFGVNAPSSLKPVAVTTNEPIVAVVERVKRLMSDLPQAFRMCWPSSFRIKRLGSVVQWERYWNSIGEQLNLSRRGAEDCLIDQWQSPFNEDFALDVVCKKEPSVQTRVPILEQPLGYVAIQGAGMTLLSVFFDILDRTTNSEVQNTIFTCIQNLPLSHREFEDDDMLMETCNGAISLEKPHEALYHLLNLYAVLVPPHLKKQTAETARRVFEFMRQARFVPRFMAMIGKIDVISEKLSLETLALFLEVCMHFIRLFLSNDSSRHRAYRKNAALLQGEPKPLDTSSITLSLVEDADETANVVEALMQFIWSTVAPRRADVEGESSRVVLSPTLRLQVAREKNIETLVGTLTGYRRAQLVRKGIATMMEVVRTCGDLERNVNILCNSDFDSDKVRFWRDLLLTTPALEVQSEARSALSSIMELGDENEERRRNFSRMTMRLVMEMGRGELWGPTAAAACIESGRNPVQLIKLAEYVVGHTRQEHLDKELLQEWINSQVGFIMEERPVWSTAKELQLQFGLHLDLLEELMKKMGGERMIETLRGAMPRLIHHILFPFATIFPLVSFRPQRGGSYPLVHPIGYSLVEGEVRMKYLEFIVHIVKEHPEQAYGILEYLNKAVHCTTSFMRAPVRTWDKQERLRRQRSESGLNQGLLLQQRLLQLHEQKLPKLDLRMVKGLVNPNFMCYANSVLQQLVFIPGVCEALFALGNTEREYGDLTEEEDIKNATLLRSLQHLFARMLFSAEEALPAEMVVNSIELPNGGNVREQQDCVEFFLTLTDKCDSAAEKMNRQPVFKQYLEGVIGYEYACKTCKHRHRGSDESFTALNLEIHGSSLGESLDHYMDGGLLEGDSAAMCEQCGEKRTTLRMGALRRAPTTLAIQLKRFSAVYDGSVNTNKLNTKCEFPPTLDLTRFGEVVRTATDEQVDQMFGWFDATQDEPVTFEPSADCAVRWRYRLVGVIVHAGQLGNGHYMSYTKERRPSMRGRAWFDHWLHINDDRVAVSDDKIGTAEWQGQGNEGENSSSAYMLWYEMIEEDAEAERLRRATVVENEEKEKDTVMMNEEEETIATVNGVKESMVVENGEKEESVSDVNGTTEEDTVMENGMEGEKENTVDQNGIKEEDTVATNGVKEEVTVVADGVEEEKSTVVQNGVAEGTVAAEVKMEVNKSREEPAKKEDNCDWVDINLGPVGVVEGPLLQLWKRVPADLQFAINSSNMHHQLSRDVHTESYASFVVQLVHVVYNYAKRVQPVESRLDLLRRLFLFAQPYFTRVVLRTEDDHAGDADALIITWKNQMTFIIKEHLELCRAWIELFYDHNTKQIMKQDPENVVLHTSMPSRLYLCINAWWSITHEALHPIRSEVPELAEAYCRYMVESLRTQMLLKCDGFASFFIHSVISPYTFEYTIKHKILPALLHTILFINEENGICIVRADMQGHAAKPAYNGLFALYREAVDRSLITEEEFKDFVTTKLAYVMIPMARFGDEYLMKIVDLFNVTLRHYSDADPRWVTRIAQVVLMSLKMEPIRANALFNVIEAVGRYLVNTSPMKGRNFFDEILGKSDNDAVDDARIQSGVIAQMELMLDRKRESRVITKVLEEVQRLLESSPVFNDRAFGYTEPLEFIQRRLDELKEEERINADNMQQSMTLQGAHELGGMPLEECGSFNRPQGSGRGDMGEMMISEDEMEEDDEDEMLSDDEGFTDDENPPMNLSNHRR